jgi:para-nitrobenzyl esterase
VDGWVLPSAPIDALRAGTHHHVPFVIGSNSDETSQSVPNTITTEMIYANAIHMVFGQALGDQVLALYPASDFRGPRAAMVAVTTDARFVCPSRAIARTVAAAQSEHVYRYFFTHALDNSPNPTVRLLGAWHGLELLWVFGHLNVAAYMPSAGETALSASMIGYWTRFAASGDPNGGGASAWPTYDVATDPYLALDDTIAAGAGIRTAKCDFWDKLSP